MPDGNNLQGKRYPEGLQANATRIRCGKSFTPLYTTLPLTDYRYKRKNGRQLMAISDEEVEQVRNFSIENKK
ncbi:MAG: hypothetical protein IKM31_04225 [Oscillospiraceae bacterium]|nr:hypothetical protein [Oscillospiraceae bacterium]